LILTGQRREEVAGLVWGELDRNKLLWTLPAARAKNGVAHDIPLSAPVIAILDAVAQQQKPSQGAPKWPGSGFVLSATGDKRVTGYSNAKKRLDRLMLEVSATATGDPNPIPAWRYHDLRRTLATGLQRLGVRFEATEAVLNHVGGSRAGVAGVYQRHHWSDEKRAALNAWAEHVVSLVGAKPQL
jgi:integrase